MRLRHGLGLAVFCLLAGSRWLIDAAWPQTMPTLLAQSVHYAVTGVIVLAISLGRPSAKPSERMQAGRIAGASLLLLGAPALIGRLADGVSSVTSVALYAMVPLCVVLTAAWMRDEVGRASMVPALAGLAGILLILPWHLPATAVGAFSLGAVMVGVVLTATASVWIHPLLQGGRLVEVLAIGTLTNAAVLGSASMVFGDRWAGWSAWAFEMLRALFLDGPAAVLLFWLLRELAPERFATRFFLVPLVTLLEGIAVLRGPVNSRTGVGLLLLLAGAGGLLFGTREEPMRLNLR